MTSEPSRIIVPAMSALPVKTLGEEQDDDLLDPMEGDDNEILTAIAMIHRKRKAKKQSADESIISESPLKDKDINPKLPLQKGDDNDASLNLSDTRDDLKDGNEDDAPNVVAARSKSKSSDPSMNWTPSLKQPVKLLKTESGTSSNTGGDARAAVAQERTHSADDH